MSYTIYKHTLILDCPHKGWSYIGQTSQSLSARWKSGKSYKDQVFGQAIQKYEWANFEHSILKQNIKTVEEANYWEEYYIKEYHTWVYDRNCKGYNVSPGGYNWDNYGKTVLQVDSHKNIINEFVSICDAARFINTSPDRISRCCNYPDLAHEVKNYFWCFKSDYENFIPSKIKKIPIYQLDEHKNILNTFNSIAEAGVAMGATKNNCISSCIRGEKCSAYGYYWCKVDEYETFELKKSPRLRAVYCLDLNKEYKNSTEAAKDMKVSSSVIMRCCNGKQCHAAGYRWMYKEDYERMLQDEERKSKN